MKLYRNAIILVVVLGLMVGAYFLIGYMKSRNTDSAADSTDTASENLKVMDLDSSKVTSMEFNSEKGAFKLTKKDNAWSMEPAMEFPLDSSVADSTTYNVASVTATKVIEDNAADLSKYGLDKPATVKVGLSDGTTGEIELGSPTPTNEGIYVKKKGETKVYLIDSYYGDQLKLDRSGFAKKDILPVEAATLKTLSYEKNGQMQYAVSINSESEMKITAPVPEEAEPSKISPMLSAVVTLAVKDIVDENPADLAQYGLDKPAFAISYGDDKTTKKILFGKDVEKGTVTYAKFPEGKSVFTIDISALTFLDIKFSDILSSFVYLPNINDVNKIELTIDGKTTVSDITTNKDDSSQDKFVVDGKDANMVDASDKSLFRAFYQAMIGITMNKYETGANPTGTPEVSIKYYMKPDNKPVTVELISKDSNYFYAMKDGVYTNRVILKSKLDEPDGIRATLKALKEAQDKAK